MSNFSFIQNIEKLEQEMRDNAVAIVSLYERAGELIDYKGSSLSRTIHRNMMFGIMQYLSTKMDEVDKNKKGNHESKNA